MKLMEVRELLQETVQNSTSSVGSELVEEILDVLISNNLLNLELSTLRDVIESLYPPTPKEKYQRLFNSLRDFNVNSRPVLSMTLESDSDIHVFSKYSMEDTAFVIKANLPGLVTHGETQREALDNLEEALMLYFESVEKNDME